MWLDLSAEKPTNDGYYYAQLPMPAEEYEIRDAIQRLRAVGREDDIWISILECGGLPELENIRLDSPTLDELNFFAKRLSSMMDEEKIMFKAVIGQIIPEDAEDELISMKDLINSTYGLDGVMIALNIYNDEELGQFVIEGELDDEVNALPDEVKLKDNSDVTIGYKIVADGSDVTTGDTILTIPAGAPDAVTTAAIGGILTEKPVYSGMYVNIATFIVSVS